MDFVTHSLIGAGIARIFTRDPALLPQRTIAAILGSTLMDGDSAIALWGQDFYGRYHRVASHSIVGLAAVALLAATIAWALAGPPRWRRFGWFLDDNLDDTHVPQRERWGAFLGIAALAAAAHWIADWITGYGNMMPLWPWLKRDVSLAAVSSFDWVLFSATLGTHLAIRWRRADRAESCRWLGAWLLLSAGYVVWRAVYGPPGIW